MRHRLSPANKSNSGGNGSSRQIPKNLMGKNRYFLKRCEKEIEIFDELIKNKYD